MSSDPASATPVLGPRLVEAFDYALQLHGRQWRKRSAGEAGPLVPYISHLMAVTALVLSHGGDEEEAIAALLHDAPEDQGGLATLAEIERRFGPRVARMVAELSDTFDRPKPPWLERKRHYLERLEETSDSTLLVSIADKVHNVRSILHDYRGVGDAVWRRFSGERDGTLWYYHSLFEVFCRRATSRARPLVEEMGRILDTLDVLTGHRPRDP